MHCVRCIVHRGRSGACAPVSLTREITRKGRHMDGAEEAAREALPDRRDHGALGAVETDVGLLRDPRPHPAAAEDEGRTPAPSSDRVLGSGARARPSEKRLHAAEDPRDAGITETRTAAGCRGDLAFRSVREAGPGLTLLGSPG